MAALSSKRAKKAVPTYDDNEMDIEDEFDDIFHPQSSSSRGNGKTVEQIYQKKTQLEHILLRPDTYIGSVEPLTVSAYILDPLTSRIVSKQITYVPGLYKIFDEILVNAADNKQRDSAMSRIDITIDPSTNTIIVRNNGRGIPIEIHKEHKCYVPELIFGHLLTGSNFDDVEKKTTGGRNGYGAKLANIFSTSFTVECVDANQGMKYIQKFTNNMQQKCEPKITHTKVSETKDYVQITFQPDLARFKMTEIDGDTAALLGKRAYDIAGTMSNRSGAKLAVYLNGVKVPVKSFKEYIELYDGISPPAAFEKIGDRWEVGVAVSDGSFQQLSFVNSICTSKGGGHTNHVTDQIANHLVKTVKKKNKGAEVKVNQIKNHICVFINCLIENPSFDSQTKENMTTRHKQFGSDCTLSDKFLKAVDKSGVVDSILAYAKFKQNEQLKRKGGAKKIKLTGIAKLDDANHAGSARSKDCTLIITEGDSAKSLAMSGLGVVGRDYYGVFPLKGKPLNVREAAHKQIMENDEIKNIVDIMGLKFGTVYDEDNVKTLRYGHLMIMADQDHDGSHIKGLVINVFHHFWPSLLDVPGFLKQFITPIVKVTKGKRSKTFFTLPEYENWKSENGDGKGWTAKYYKGLGTSTSAEAKEYFSNLNVHEVHFSTLSSDKQTFDFISEGEAGADVADVADFADAASAPTTPSSSSTFTSTTISSSISSSSAIAIPKPTTIEVTGSDCIDMAFSKSRVEDRKLWLNKLAKNTYLNYSQVPSSGVTYSDFVNRELILFSQADNTRSIPHAFDGFKPSQRKVLFCCFKRKLKGEIKVAQLAGYIGEHSAYHHGELSLTGTIIGMAQAFVGANNLNLLTPSGQFGTRRMGGKDCASARYVFTKLEKITRLIFHPDDDALLTYLNDDGLNIEPEFYMPVIPLVLVNGAEGIGTGWSCNIPNYSARDVINNIRCLINNEPTTVMMPSYAGFHGEIVLETGARLGSFVVKGRIERVDDTTLVISELPVKKWTQDYKVFLEGMLAGHDEGKGKGKGKGKAAAVKKTPQKKKGTAAAAADGEDEDEVTSPAPPPTPVKSKGEIKDFKENHTDTTVSFTITADKETIDAWEQIKNGGLYNKFKLTVSVSTSNMNLFDGHDRIARFASPESVLLTFFKVRLDYYHRRKAGMLKILKRERSILDNKAKFVHAVCEGTVKVGNRKRKELLGELLRLKFEVFYTAAPGSVKSNVNDDDDDDDDDDDKNDSTQDAQLAKGYEYLLGMKLWSLTSERAAKLKKELSLKDNEVKALEKSAPHQIWWNDLDAIEDALDERDVELKAAAEGEVRAQGRASRANMEKTKRLARKGGKKRKGWDSDDEESDEDVPVMREDDDDDDEDEQKVTKAKKGRKSFGSTSAVKVNKTVRPPAPVDAPEVIEIVDGVHLYTQKTKAEKVKKVKKVKVEKVKVEKVAARPKVKSAATPKSKAKSAVKGEEGGGDVIEIDDSDEDDGLTTPAAKGKAMKPASASASAKKKAATTPATKEKAVKKPAASATKSGTKRKGKAQTYDSDEDTDEEEDDDEEDDDEDGDEVVGKKRWNSDDENSEEDDVVSEEEYDDEEDDDSVYIIKKPEKK